MVIYNNLLIWGAIWSTIFITAQGIPKGHLEPLGSHRPKEGSVVSLNDVPFPRDFFYNYVLTSTPVIFRGAAKLSKGFKLWNDNYLRYCRRIIYILIPPSNSFVRQLFISSTITQYILLLRPSANSIPPPWERYQYFLELQNI